ncbi:ISPg2 transposase [Porphyromonas gingivalis]|nr:ISPg2 transposase [Porphyromonas gingivalis]
MYSVSIGKSLYGLGSTRIESKEVYPLDFLLLIVFLSMLSGDISWYEIEDYAEEYEEVLKSRHETFLHDAGDLRRPTVLITTC